MRQHFLRLLAAVASGIGLAAITLVGFDTVASANYFGTGGGGCCLFADNSLESFNYDSTTTSTHNALDYAKSNLVSQTHMTASYIGDNSQTDYVGYDQYYTNYWNLDWDGSTTGFNIFAYTKCVSTAGADAGTCQRYEGRFDLADLDGFSTAQKHWVTCHEVGHGIGLDHSTDSTSCLQTNNVYSVVHYSAHDVNHINGRW
jgi:hypothetical protein